MNFKNWLLSENNEIRFARFSSDGEITVYINGNKYEYRTDPVYHQKWQQLARFKPFTVLNAIKSQVNGGFAQLLSTQVVHPKIKSDFPEKQKTLF